MPPKSTWFRLTVGSSVAAGSSRVGTVVDVSRAEKQALASQLSLAAASSRIQLLARRQGLVPADPTQTTYVRLGHRAR